MFYIFYVFINEQWNIFLRGQCLNWQNPFNL